METKHFEIVLQTISTGLVEKIITETGVNEDTAIENLYFSALYSMLEREETKVWHYSVPLLYKIYKEEATTGRLRLPEH